MFWCSTCKFIKRKFNKFVDHKARKIFFSRNLEHEQPQNFCWKNNSNSYFWHPNRFLFNISAALEHALVPFVLHSSRNLITEGYFCFINLHCNGSMGKKDWARTRTQALTFQTNQIMRRAEKHSSSRFALAAAEKHWESFLLLLWSRRLVQWELFRYSCLLSVCMAICKQNTKTFSVYNRLFARSLRNFLHILFWFT